VTVFVVIWTNVLSTKKMTLTVTCCALTLIGAHSTTILQMIQTVTLFAILLTAARTTVATTVTAMAFAFK